MKILIVVASKHGSTTGIAQRIETVLRARGHMVDVVAAEHAPQVDGADVDACVIGSAIYLGSWMRAARVFATTNAVALQRLPVWLFSSGPVGNQPQVGMATGRIDELTQAVDAVDHRLFAGRLARSELNPMERLLARLVRAPEGDYRDWDDIDRWATAIANRLDEAAGVGQVGRDTSDDTGPQELPGE